MNCPHDCGKWARMFLPSEPMTNHHPNCPLVNESMMTVWRVKYDGSSFFTDRKPLPEEINEGETVTEEQIHREIFEQLPEHAGF